MQHRSDSIRIETDLPFPYPFNPTNQHLSLKFETAPRHGEEYIQTNFPSLPYTIIETSTGVTRHGQPSTATTPNRK